jgi:hypothetical protein
MNDWEPAVGEPVVFEMADSIGTHEIIFMRFRDGGAYIQGEEEIIFEERDSAWKEALGYLREKGYVRKISENKCREKG